MSGDPLSDERLTEIRERRDNLRDIMRNGRLPDAESLLLAYAEDAADLLAEVRRLRARVAELEGGTD